MLKDFTWSFFEKTGSVETFLEYNKMTGVQKEKNIDGREICAEAAARRNEGKNDGYCKRFDN